MENKLIKITQRAIVIILALLMIGSCPPDQVIIKLRGEELLIIRKDALLAFTAKSETLKSIIKELEDEQKAANIEVGLREINLPSVDKAVFEFLIKNADASSSTQEGFLKLMLNGKNSLKEKFLHLLDVINYLDLKIPSDLQEAFAFLRENYGIFSNKEKFRKVLFEAEKKMGERFQRVLEMLDYLNINLPSDFTVNRKVEKRKIESTEETKRLKTEERELLTIIFPKEELEAKPIIAILSASTVLKTLIQDIYEVSPEKLSPGKKIVLGNISQEEWEILKKLATAARDLNNEGNVTHLFNNISFNSEQLLKFLQLADYLDMPILSKVIEKKVSGDLLKKLFAMKVTDAKNLLLEISSFPSTWQPSIARNVILQNDFLSSYGWKTNEINISNMIASNDIIADLIFNENNIPVIFLISPESFKILWIKNTIDRLTYEFAGRGLRINQKGTVCMFLGKEALRFCDLNTQKDMTSISFDQLGMTRSALDGNLFPGTLSYDGTMAAIRVSDTRIQIINLENINDVRITSLNGQFSVFSGLAFDAAKKTLAISALDAFEIQLWDISSESKQKIIPVTNGVEQIFFGKDGNVITKTRNSFSIWDIKSGSWLKSSSVKGTILGFNSMMEQVFVQNKENLVKIFNLKTDEIITAIKRNEQLTAAAVNSNDVLFLSAMKNRVTLSKNVLRPIINKLSLTQLFTFLIIYRLQPTDKQAEFRLPQEILQYFQELPEELQKEIVEKLKIKL